jgi:hypothetical protein
MRSRRYRAIERSRLSANHQVDLSSILGEGERRLPSRVRAADHDGGIAGTQLLTCRIDWVSDIQPLIISDPRNRQASALSAEGEDHATGKQLVTVIQRYHVKAVPLR